MFKGSGIKVPSMISVLIRSLMKSVSFWVKLKLDLRDMFSAYSQRNIPVISIRLFWYVFFNREFYVKPIDCYKPGTELVGYVFSKNRKK